MRRRRLILDRAHTLYQFVKYYGYNYSGKQMQSKVEFVGSYVLNYFWLWKCIFNKLYCLMEHVAYQQALLVRLSSKVYSYTSNNLYT